MKGGVIIYILLGIACTSCMTETSYYTTLHPELEFTPGTHEVYITTAYDTNLLDFNKEKKVSTYSQGALNVLRSIDNELYYKSKVVSHYAEPIKGNAYSEMPDTLDVEKRIALCKKLNKHYLIVLESFDLYFDKEVDVVQEEDGSKTKTAYYDLVAVAGIALYDSQGGVSNKIIEQIYPNYDERGVLSGLLAVGPSMAKASDEIEELTKAIGIEYVSKFYPKEVEITKAIYTHSKLGKSSRYMVKRDWNTAIKILLPLTDHPDKEIAGKAAYNLSVAYEGQHMPEESAFWYKKAEQWLEGKILPDQYEN